MTDKELGIVFVTVWLAVGFGLPVAMLVLYYLKKLFKIKE